MVRNHQWQLNTTLLGALLDRHPPGGLTDDSIAKPPRPAITKGGGRRNHDMSLEGLLVTIQSLAQIAKIDALLLIIGAQLFLRTMKIDRGIMA